MSTAIRSDMQSSAEHIADTHDRIRVQGARENNLKDVSVEIPKRRLTVFTGVSGSGKSSLVFDTIAAESQRMINETYSAFVQGFMPNLARPDVDVLEGLTTAIIVNQERMGSNPRSTVGTATDANALLRILFSRLGQPHIGPPTAFSFNVPRRTASGSMTSDTGERLVVRNAVYHGGMCPRCEGMGSINDFDLTALYDDSKSLNEGALTIPGYSMDGWYGRIFRGSGFFNPDKPIRKYTKKELHDLLYKKPTKIKVEGINLTYEGLIPRIQKSFLSKDVEAMQPHIRAFVERAVTFTTCPDCDGTRLSKEARSSSDTLGFEVRNDVGYQGMRWITVGPAEQRDTSIVLHPPAIPGITEDERRTILELMAKGSYFGVNLATTDLDGTFAKLEASGAEVVQEPMEQPYGVRDCAVRDPAGNLIRIQER